jgi:hypothetical protein
MGSTCVLPVNNLLFGVHKAWTFTSTSSQAGFLDDYYTNFLHTVARPFTRVAFWVLNTPFSTITGKDSGFNTVSTCITAITTSFNKKGY